MAILRPLTDELMRLLDQKTGTTGVAVASTANTIPPPPNAPRRIASKLIPCSRCGRAVAFLIFADDGTLEDHARLMYGHIKEQGLPTYIIGPPEGAGPLKLRPGAVQQVYPQRGPVQRLSMQYFDQVIEAVEATHCSGRSGTSDGR